MTKVIRAIFTQILPGHDALRFVHFTDESGAVLEDTAVGEWSADGEHEALELRLATGADRQTTRCKDLNGTELFVGDRVRYATSGPETKEEHWNPEYEITFEPGRFGLRHVGGGKDGGAHDFILRSGGRNGSLELIERAGDVAYAPGLVPITWGEAVPGDKPASAPEWQPPALEWNTIMSHGGDQLIAKFENFEARISLRGSTQAYIDEKKAHFQAEFNGYARHVLKLLEAEPAPPLPERTDTVVEAVRADLHRRSQLGITKYGTTLAENSGDHRAKLQHFYEELLDGANYCKWAIMELDANANRD